VMPDGSTHAIAFRGASYPTSHVFSTKEPNSTLGRGARRALARRELSRLCGGSVRWIVPGTSGPAEIAASLCFHQSSG